MKKTKIKFKKNSFNLSEFTSKYYTEKELLEIVKDYGYAVGKIDNPSEKVQLLAIKNNLFNITEISNPTRKTMDYARDCARDLGNEWEDISLMIKLYDEEHKDNNESLHKIQQ